jgi:uncharacterized membrane protein
MKNKVTWMETILLAAPFVVLGLWWKQLPTRIPVHWNFFGEVDKWGSRFSLLLAPLSAVILIALLRFLPSIDPKLRRTAGEHGRMPAILPVVRLTLLLLFDLIFALQIAVSLGANVDSNRIIMIALLVVLGVMGNFFGNLRPNYFVGIRTPWTLRDAQTWRATHRLGGRLIVFGSLLLLTSQFFLSTRLFGWLTGCALFFLVVWAVLYSWHHFQRHGAATY